jgi:hypothetical protein
MLRGETIEATWSQIPLTVASPENPPPSSDDFMIGAMFP